MLVSRERLKSVFRKVSQIQEHIRSYVLAPDKLPVSVEDVQWVIQDMYTLKVQKYEVATTATFLRGMVLRYSNGNADILVRADQPDTWKRFTAVKELCQLAIDEQEDWSTEAHSTIAGLLEAYAIEVSQPVNHHAPHGFIVSEHLAAYAAIEILYPHDLRGKDAVDIASKASSFSSLSLKYQIPTPLLARAHDDAYKELCSEFRWNSDTEKNA